VRAGRGRLGERNEGEGGGGGEGEQEKAASDRADDEGENDAGEETAVPLTVSIFGRISFIVTGNKRTRVFGNSMNQIDYVEDNVDDSGESGNGEADNERVYEQPVAEGGVRWSAKDNYFGRETRCCDQKTWNKYKRNDSRDVFVPGRLDRFLDREQNSGYAVVVCVH